MMHDPRELAREAALDIVDHCTGDHGPGLKPNEFYRSAYDWTTDRIVRVLEQDRAERKARTPMKTVPQDGKPMELCNISTASFGERRRHYLEQAVGPDAFKKGDTERIASASVMAQEQTTQDMFDEIHAMLRKLLELQGVKMGR